MREMKNSGIEWIGEIPKKWKILRFKNISNLYTGNSIKDEEKNRYEDENEALPYISSKDINVLNNAANYRNGMYIKKGDNSFKKAKKESTLMCIEGGSAGKKKTFLSEDVCFVNKLCCFDSSQDINNKYLFYFLNSPNYEEEFKLNLSGMIGGVSVSTLKNLKLCLPSLQEQSRIASFLDSKCSEIDSLHSDINDQIETLKEYKKSVITEAVTKGLDPDAEMKDSRNKLIGMISKINCCKRIKHCINGMADGTHGTFKRTSEGRYLLSAKNVFENGLHISDNESLISEADYRLIVKNTYPQKGDILLCCVGTIGRCAIYKEEEPIAFQRSVIFLRCNKKIIMPKMLFYCMQTSQVYAQERLLINKSAQEGLYQSSVSELYITFPKEKENQQKIVDYLDSKCLEIDSIIESKQQQLETLEQYKKSLIYEYVTGKKEVPASA
jgi:type I restriction enzyme, S subunit